MGKLHEITIEGQKYRSASGSVGEAVKKAINAYLDGREAPKKLTLSVTSEEIGPVEKVG